MHHFHSWWMGEHPKNLYIWDSASGFPGLHVSVNSESSQKIDNSSKTNVRKSGTSLCSKLFQLIKNMPYYSSLELVLVTRNYPNKLCTKKVQNWALRRMRKKSNLILVREIEFMPRWVRTLNTNQGIWEGKWDQISTRISLKSRLLWAQFQPTRQSEWNWYQSH